MQITTDYLIDMYIGMFYNRNAHEDYIKVNQEKLEIINKHLGVEGLITFDRNGFKFNMINGDYCNMSMMPETTTGYLKGYKIDKSNSKSVSNYISMNINRALKKIVDEYTIGLNGVLETNQDFEFSMLIAKSRATDKMLFHIKNTMDAIYKESIMGSLYFMYGKNYQGYVKRGEKRKDLIGWNINCEVSDDYLSEVKTLDDYDYF